MATLTLVETVNGARPLAGAGLLVFCRSFRAQRPVREHRFTFLPTEAALDLGATRDTLSSGMPLDNIPANRRDAYALVVNLGGEFHTVDKMLIERASTGVTEILIQLLLTRVESADGEPAPLDVFLIVPLTPEILRFNRIRIAFSVRHRSYTEQIRVLDGVIDDCVVGLTGS